ncbi:MAG: hypothetical protein ABIE68_01515 [bacterium]
MEDGKIDYDELKQMERRLISAAPSLKQTERELVLGALKKQLDSGGVSSWELREILMDLRKQNAISETDKKAVKRLAEEYLQN